MENEHVTCDLLHTDKRLLALAVKLEDASFDVAEGLQEGGPWADWVAGGREKGDVADEEAQGHEGVADLVGPFPELVRGRDGQVGDDKPVAHVDLEAHVAIFRRAVCYI